MTQKIEKEFNYYSDLIEYLNNNHEIINLLLKNAELIITTTSLAPIYHLKVYLKV